MPFFWAGPGPFPPPSPMDIIWPASSAVGSSDRRCRPPRPDGVQTTACVLPMVVPRRPLCSSRASRGARRLRVRDLRSPDSSSELHCRTELTRIKRSGDCSCSIKHLCYFEHCRSDSWVFLETPQCHSYKPFHYLQIENCFSITLHQKINSATPITITCPVSQYFLILCCLQLNITPTTDELQQDDPIAVDINLSSDTNALEPLGRNISSGAPYSSICLCLVGSQPFG